MILTHLAKFKLQCTKQLMAALSWCLLVSNWWEIWDSGTKLWSYQTRSFDTIHNNQQVLASDHRTAGDTSAASLEILNTFLPAAATNFKLLHKYWVHWQLMCSSSKCFSSWKESHRLFLGSSAVHSLCCLPKSRVRTANWSLKWNILARLGRDCMCQSGQRWGRMKLQTKVNKVREDFTIMEKAPTSAFTFKTLIRHYAKSQFCKWWNMCRGCT